VFGILFFFNGAFGADKYVIDPAHTSMGFAIRHLVINTHFNGVCHSAFGHKQS
jgi:polyisoprenoid-binding protein YceI